MNEERIEAARQQLVIALGRAFNEPDNAHLQENADRAIDEFEAAIRESSSAAGGGIFEPRLVSQVHNFDEQGSLTPVDRVEEAGTYYPSQDERREAERVVRSIKDAYAAESSSRVAGCCEHDEARHIEDAEGARCLDCAIDQNYGATVGRGVDYHHPWPLAASRVAEPEEIARIRALAEAATPGPWVLNDPSTRDGTSGEIEIIDGQDEPAAIVEWFDSESALGAGRNARFIAAARTAVPLLLADRAALAASLAEVEARRDALLAGEDVGVAHPAWKAADDWDYSVGGSGWGGFLAGWDAALRALLPLTPPPAAGEEGR